MNLIAIETALKAIQYEGKALFNSVHTAIDPATVVDKGLIKTDCAFVIPVAESAESNERTTGTFSQEIQISFAVMYGVKAINDKLGSNINARLHTIKTETRKSILGLEIGPEYDEVEFVQGELVQFYAGGAFWLDQFKSNYLYEQEQQP